jgi:hypothetical protein
MRSPVNAGAEEKRIKAVKAACDSLQFMICWLAINEEVSVVRDFETGGILI